VKTISHSGLRLWRNCRRQYKHAYIDLRRPVNVALALAVGKVWDLALEAWHHRGRPDAARRAVPLSDQ
jgi:hypothetical protein